MTSRAVKRCFGDAPSDACQFPVEKTYVSRQLLHNAVDCGGNFASNGARTVVFFAHHSGAVDQLFADFYAEAMKGKGAVLYFFEESWRAHWQARPPAFRHEGCRHLLVSVYEIREIASALTALEFSVDQENGVRYQKPERPEGCFAFWVPDPFSADRFNPTSWL